MPSDLAAVASLSSVSKRMGTTLALDDLSLGIRPGEVTALLGPNGAGKTTAVGVLTGRLLPDAGSADLFGLDPRRPAARARMGVMLQAASLPDVLTVRELIALQSGYFVGSRKIDDTLALAGLAELADRRGSALSGGQSRRLQFALAICGWPDLLILDEPTTGLDSEARRGLWTTVRDTADDGAAVLLTTHYLEEAEALADRVVVVAEGRIVADGTTAEIRASIAGATIRCRTGLPEPALRGLPQVRRALRSGGEARLLSGDAVATVRALLERDADCADLRIEAASLEDALSTLTDKTLKEAA